MTDARRKARIAMLKKGITFEDLAKQTGYSVATIHNVLSNTASTAKARQAITNALGVQLWDGAPLTARSFVLKPGNSIELSDELGRPGYAEKFARLFHRSLNFLDPGAVSRTGNVIHFTRPLQLSLEVVNGETRRLSKTQKREKPKTLS